MPEDILRIGTEFDVAPLISGAQNAGVATEQLKAKFGELAAQAEASGQTIQAQAARFMQQGLSAKEAQSALQNLGTSEQEAATAAAAMAAAAGVQAEALTTVAAAATKASDSMGSFGARNAMVRTELGALSGSSYMAEFGLARIASQSELLGPLLMAAFPAFAALALVEILGQLYQKFEQVANEVVGYTKAVQDAEKADIKFSDAALGHANSLADAQEKLHANIVAQGDLAAASYGDKFVNALEKAQQQTSSWWGPLQGVVTTVRALSAAESEGADYAEKLRHAQELLTEQESKYQLETARQVEQLNAARLESQKAGIATGPESRVEQLQLEIANKKENLGLDQQIAGIEAQRAGEDPNIARLVARQKSTYELLALNRELAQARQQANDEERNQLDQIIAFETNLARRQEQRAAEMKAIAAEETAMFEEESLSASKLATTETVKLVEAEEKYADVATKGRQDSAVRAIESQETEAKEILKIQEGEIAASGANATRKARMLADAEIAELNQLKAIEADKLKVILDGLKAEQDALDVTDIATGKKAAVTSGDFDKLRQYQQIQNQIDQVTQQSAAKQQQYNLQIVQSNQQAANTVAENWQRAMDKVGHAFQSEFDQVVRGTETVKFAFIKLGGDMVIALLHSLEQMLLHTVANELAMATAHAAGTQAQVATSAAGASEKKTIEAGSALSSIAKSAASAAAKAYEALAGVPIVGPALGAAAAAATFTAVLAFDALIGSAQQGAVVPQDMMIAAHQNEMILPEHISTPLQGAIPAISRFNAALGENSAIPLAAGAGGSGRSTTNNFTISALDPESMAGYLRRNQGTVMNLVRGAVRNGARLR